MKDIYNNSVFHMPARNWNKLLTSLLTSGEDVEECASGFASLLSSIKHCGLDVSSLNNSDSENIFYSIN